MVACSSSSFHIIAIDWASVGPIPAIPSWGLINSRRGPSWVRPLGLRTSFFPCLLFGYLGRFCISGFQIFSKSPQVYHWVLDLHHGVYVAKRHKSSTRVLCLSKCWACVSGFRICCPKDRNLLRDTDIIIFSAPQNQDGKEIDGTLCQFHWTTGYLTTSAQLLFVIPASTKYFRKTNKTGGRLHSQLLLVDHTALDKVLPPLLIILLHSPNTKAEEPVSSSNAKLV